jgi:hypothetical protein
MQIMEVGQTAFSEGLQCLVISDSPQPLVGHYQYGLDHKGHGCVTASPGGFLSCGQHCIYARVCVSSMRILSQAPSDTGLNTEKCDLINIEVGIGVALELLADLGRQPGLGQNRIAARPSSHPRSRRSYIRSST